MPRNEVLQPYVSDTDEHVLAEFIPSGQVVELGGSKTIVSTPGLPPLSDSAGVIRLHSYSDTASPENGDVPRSNLSVRSRETPDGGLIFSLYDVSDAGEAKPNYSRFTDMVSILPERLPVPDNPISDMDVENAGKIAKTKPEDADQSEQPQNVAENQTQSADRVKHLQKDSKNFAEKISRRRKWLAAGLAALATWTYNGETANAMFHIVSENMATEYAGQWSDLANSTKWDGSKEFITLNDKLADKEIQWAQRVSTGWIEDEDSGNPNRHTIPELVEKVRGSLDSGTEYVMFDELKAGTIEHLKEFAILMSQKYPHLNGRWGVFLVDGYAVGYPAFNQLSDPETSNLTPEQQQVRLLDLLLDIGAPIAMEFYPSSNSYFRNIPLKTKVRIKGTSKLKSVTIPFNRLSPSQRVLARDRFFADYIAGRGAKINPKTKTRAGWGYNNRYKGSWLIEKAIDRGSESPLPIILPVGTRFLGGAKNEIDMLARLAYIVRNHTTYGRWQVNKSPLGSWKYGGKFNGAGHDNWVIRINQQFVYKGKRYSLRPVPKRFNVYNKATLREFREDKQPFGYVYNESRQKNFKP